MKLNSILLGSADSKALAAFYTKILGQPSWSSDDGEWFGYSLGGFDLAIGPHSEVKGKNQSPGRIMFNFETEDVQDEFDRIKALGADVIAVPYHPGEAPDMWMATFADPDGNYFQLASPWKSK